LIYISVYFIAQIQIHNENEYQHYLNSAEKIFSKHKGEYLAIDDDPMCLEGFWEEARIVLIKFPSKADFKAWYCSDEYQNILIHRLTGAQCDSVLINGK